MRNILKNTDLQLVFIILLIFISSLAIILAFIFC